MCDLRNAQVVLDKQFQCVLASGTFDHFGKRCPLFSQMALESPSAQADRLGNLCNAEFRIFWRTSHGLFDHLENCDWIALDQRENSRRY